MSEQELNFFTRALESQAEATALIEKLTEVAHSDAVVSQPITEQGHTAIVVSEVMLGLGAGFGSGQSAKDAGTGGGGGGYSMSRPVALIQIGPNGVQQESLMDVTKVSIALIATIGGLFLSWLRVRKASQQ